MENRYETNREEHINLICERCKKILDYNVPIAVDQRGVAKRTGFSITDTRLEYYGYCLLRRSTARSAFLFFSPQDTRFHLAIKK